MRRGPPRAPRRGPRPGRAPAGGRWRLRAACAALLGPLCVGLLAWRGAPAALPPAQRAPRAREPPALPAPLRRGGCPGAAAPQRRGVVAALGAALGVPAPAARAVTSLAPPDATPTFRTLRPPPEIPVATAVILLRTTQEAATDWGGALSDAGKYQASFFRRRSNAFPGWKNRYSTYDLSGLYNETLLQTKDPRTNRLYFAFLNEVQWRTIADSVTRSSDQDRFSRVVGDRLYRKILRGDVVGPRILLNDTWDENAPVDETSPYSGRWPALKPALTKSAAAGDLADGARRLLAYLQSQGYCKDFVVSDFRPGKDGMLEFRSFVDEPVNIEATSALVRSASTFLPRYDQRVLQAFFADRGFDCSFDDELADGIERKAAQPKLDPQQLRGVRTRWRLVPDPDAGL